ncbi:hypothetical protein HK096_010461, partial [Nowakowskiella sp. JEL0078]
VMIPGKGTQQLCFIQWYEVIEPGKTNETKMVEVRLKDPINGGLQVVEPECIA